MEPNSITTRVATEGRKLGWCLAWLEDAENWESAEFHEECAAFTEEVRMDNRRRFKATAGSAPFLEAKGKLEDGEPEEQPGFFNSRALRRASLQSEPNP